VLTVKLNQNKAIIKRVVIVGASILLVSVALTACGKGYDAEWQGEPRRSAEGRPYFLGPGDRVRITVYRDEDLSGTYGINSSGRISLPLVGGVEAQGLTIPELERVIKDLLGRDYLKDPSVSIELSTSRPFCVLGQVNKPGCFEFISGMRGAVAIATAGGYTYRAKENRLLITGEDGKKLIGDHDTPIFPGDTIEIEERYF
jgi:polysaccharide export outer membrane protein